MKALGMIEVYGYLAAVEALDSALKAANVSLISVTKVRGGLVTVLVTGDVGSVKAAMDASAAAASRVGEVISVHTIPRPADDIEKMLTNQPPHNPAQKEQALAEQDEKPEVADVQAAALAAEEIILAEENAEEPCGEGEASDDEVISESRVYSREELLDMKVVKLRDIARAIGLDTMSKKDIRFAKKDELVEKICEFQNRRDE